MDLVAKDKKVLLVGINKQPKYLMERIDIIPDLIPDNQLFNDFKSSILWMKENVKDEF